MAHGEKRQPNLGERLVDAVVGPLVSPVIDHVDVNEVVERIDVDQLLDGVDVNAFLDRVDINALLERVEVDELLERVDVDALLDRADVNRLLARADVEGVITRVDVDGLIQRVDVNALIARVDTNALLQETELGAIIAQSTTGVFGRLLDVARSQVVTLDLVLHRVVNRLLRRGKVPLGAPALPAGRAVDTALTDAEPVDTAQADAEVTDRFVAPQRDIELQGHYAGAVSRLLAFTVDILALGAVFSLLLALFGLGWEVVFSRSFEPGANGLAIFVAYLAWSVLYFAFPWAMSGKSVGMAILGIQVRRSDGAHVDGRHALIRVLTLPLSFLLLGIGLVIGLVQRQHRCLHDLLAGTVVVYSWDARRAKLRLITRPSDRAGYGARS